MFLKQPGPLVSQDVCSTCISLLGTNVVPTSTTKIKFVTNEVGNF